MSVVEAKIQTVEEMYRLSLVRAITAISAKLRSSPGDLVGKLANAIATPEPLIAKVWGRFRFPAGLDEHQLSSCSDRALGCSILPATTAP
jgi:hypothetical protein